MKIEINLIRKNSRIGRKSQEFLRGMGSQEEVEVLEDENLGERELIGLDILINEQRTASEYNYVCKSDEVKCITLHSLDFKQIRQKFYKQELNQNSNFFK